MRHFEIALVAVVFVGATIEKAMQFFEATRLIDTSTTIGIAASASVGTILALWFCATGIVLTVICRRALMR